MKYNKVWAFVGLAISLQASDRINAPSHVPATQSPAPEITFDFIQAPQECLQDASKRRDAIDLSAIATQFPTLGTWVTACRNQPPYVSYRAGQHSAFFWDKTKQANVPTSPLKAASKNVAAELLNIVDIWVHMMARGPLKQRCLWNKANNGQIEPDKDFYKGTHDEFFPYIQKIVAKSGDRFFIHGDLHGDVRSLCRELSELHKNNIIDNNFRIIPDDVWLLFLGDYVDRGVYGAEVIYTLLRLSLANPDRVILVRGNHEDCGINEKGGFEQELREKFGRDNDRLIRKIQSIYNFMPVALYLGVPDNSNTINYVQCCHGGMEIGYDPKPFLDTTQTQYQQLGVLHRQAFVDRHTTMQPKLTWKQWVESLVKKLETKEHNYWSSLIGKVKDQVHPRATIDVGFMWNDFEPGLDALDRTKQVIDDAGRGYRFGKLATQDILQDQSSYTSRIRGVIRAHQHGDSAMMQGLLYNNGVYKLWSPVNEHGQRERTMDDGLVWTFNVAPDTNIGRLAGLQEYTYADLILDTQYSNWRMKIFNIPLA